jgi:hypothetical protein
MSIERPCIAVDVRCADSFRVYSVISFPLPMVPTAHGHAGDGTTTLRRQGVSPEPCQAERHWMNRQPVLKETMEATVHRVAATFFLLVVTAVLPIAGEEISLRDGTTIVGHMTAISPEKIEVETSYGKIQLRRTDILSISFPENGTPAVGASEPLPAKREAPKIDEALNGIQYVNRTGGFVLTVPPDWMVNTDLHRAPETLTTLSSHDKLRYLLVMREEYPGSLESYKQLTLLSARRTLGNFEELGQSLATIDGKSALLVFYRGTLQQGTNLPVEFLSAIIASGRTYTKVTVWCVEPLFHDMQPAFEKIVNSYRSTGGQTTAATSKP